MARRAIPRGTANRARRAELSGAGPAGPGHLPARLPGATARFALFGEILVVGLLVAALSLPVITVPLAIAVGARHLRRYLRAEGSTLRDVWSDVRRGILPSLGIGAAVLVLVAALLIDVALAVDRIIPAAEVILSVGIVGLVLVAVAVVAAAGDWSPEAGWRAAAASCWSRWRTDPIGVLYLLAAIGFVAVVSWQLPPLVIPGLGCLVLALVAIPERRSAG